MEVIKTVLKSNKKQEEKMPFTKLMTLEEISKFKNEIFRLDRSKMLLRMFEAHGQFCASHPWEVIFVTLTLIVCATSVSYVEPNLESNATVMTPNSRTFDVAILAVTRCLAIAYIYLQFSKLRNLGSKYLLGITGILTLMFSFSLSAAVVNFFGSDVNSLSEAMPIFLLLVDLSKACTLAKFALSSKCQDEIISNIGQGMAMVGPVMTLDAVVEALVIGVGTLSGIRALQTMCCFGCLSVVVNYFAFMTFYPACLTIVLELTGDHRRLVQIQQLAKVWQSEDESQKPNPVTQKVKMIMSAGLLFVHIHTRFASSSSSTTILGNPMDEVDVSDGLLNPTVGDNQNLTFWQFLFERSSGFSIDYLITISLITVLSFKYIFDSDQSNDRPQPSEDNKTASDSSRSNGCLSNAAAGFGDGDVVGKKDSPPKTYQETGTQTEADSDTKSKFFLESDSSDEDSELKTKQLLHTSTQTSDDFAVTASEDPRVSKAARSLNECIEVFRSQEGTKALTDDEIVGLVDLKLIAAYKLEDVLNDLLRGVSIRRKVIGRDLPSSSLVNLPYLNYNYSYVKNQCCENVIGYMPVPVGVAGPLLVNGKHYLIPMATTEGCLVASTNRGCRALSHGKGVTSVVVRDAMTRAPLVRFGSILRAAMVKAWLERQENFEIMAEAFNGTSRFARLKELMVCQVSRNLYIRFSAATGDAMGMNMVSKGCQAALLMLQEKYFNDMEILSLSGNFCTDKKPNAINWIEGRGKSVVSEAVIPGSVVKNVLKTDVDTLVDLNINKNYIGSMAAGSIGGFNAHASNIVTALFIATGQDPAQNISSSNCITVFEKHGADDLHVSCTMPCLEVGTVGGGTILPPQAACLEMLGVRGSNDKEPGLNSSTLASIICSTVMAGELSLMSALASGDLVKSHLKHNRSVINIAQPTTPMPPCMAS